MKKVHLTREQRYTISAMNRQCCTQKMIAGATGKNRSVAGRELKRNTSHTVRCCFEYARDMAMFRKERMKKPRKLHPWLKREITELVRQDRLPQQIEGRLKFENKFCVCHETACKMIRRDRNNGGTLYKHTRHQLKYRKRQAGY